MGYLPGNVLAFSLTNIITYLLSRHFVFSPTDRKKRHEAALFIAFLCGGLAINQTVLWAVVEFVGIDYKLSKIVAILVTIVWNFFTRKYIVFKPNQTEVESESLKNS
jgi:putative flippase GtrA